MSKGFKARSMIGGGVNQSAVQAYADVPESISDVALRVPVRATVLAVYYPEEDSERVSSGAWAVTLDVRTLDKYQRYLPRVPLYDACAGLFDEDLRIPRAASVVVGGGILATENSGSAGPQPTEASSTDADQVMIWFEEGNPRKPFAVPISCPHPKRNNKPTKADGRVRRIRHNGTIIEIDKDGNVTIDASAAQTDALTATGAAVPNAAGGNILIKTNATPGLLSLQEATDFVIKGNTFKTAIDQLLDIIDTWAQAIQSSAAAVPAAPVTAGIAAFKAASAQWLSTRTKTG
jgi:hypothetical protein